MSGGMTDLERMLDRLFTAGNKLSAGLTDKLLAFGPALEEPLLELVADDALFSQEARGRGFAPVHALRLLGRMRVTRGIPRMLEILIGNHDETYAHGAAYHGLIDMGPAALEPCLAARAASDDPEVRSSLVHLVAQLGVRDDRVYELLVGELDVDPGLVGVLLGEYGDPRGLPLVVRVLDELTDDDLEALIEDPGDSQDVIELVAAIEALGGTPHPQHLDLRHRIIADRRERYGDGSKRTPLRASDSPGRNDPCPCGSGRKYKKCHLRGDEAAESE